MSSANGHSYLHLSAIRALTFSCMQSQTGRQADRQTDRTDCRTYMMQGCHTPPPPPTPWYPPLPVKWVVILFGLVAFPSGLVWPRPPSPPVEWGLWSFWLAPPHLWGAVCSTEVWYGCCRLLVVMSSLRARDHTKYDVALFSLQTVPLSLL